MTRLVQLSRPQWIVLMSFIAIFLPLTLIGVFHSDLVSWYSVTTLAPDLERDLGFKAIVALHPALATAAFQISSVEPTGVFGRAGVKIGDLPMRIHHGPGDFYAFLERSRGSTITLDFLRALPTGEVHELSGAMVSVSLLVPLREQAERAFPADGRSPSATLLVTPAPLAVR